MCDIVSRGRDVVDGHIVGDATDGMRVESQSACCDACNKNEDCETWVYDSSFDDQGSCSCDRESGWFDWDCKVAWSECGTGFNAGCDGGAGIGSCSKCRCRPTDEKNCWLYAGVTELKTADSGSALRTTGGKIPSTDTCASATPGLDVADGPEGGTRIGGDTKGAVKAKSQAECCQACNDEDECETWVWATDSGDSQGDTCWLLKDVKQLKIGDNRNVGGQLPEIPGPHNFDPNCRVVASDYCEDTSNKKLCVKTKSKK